MGGEPFEIIGIHDAQSMSEGYNRGFAMSSGEMVVFSHDDIEFWVGDLAGRLKGLLGVGGVGVVDVVGVAGTNRLCGPQWVTAGAPYTFGVVPQVLPDGRIRVMMFGSPRRLVEGIQALDGVFLACRREVAEKVAWDAVTFDGFHHYDLDWTYRAFRAGFRLGVAVDLPILHMSGGTIDETWRNSAPRFLEKHAGTMRMMFREFAMARVSVGSRDEAMEVLGEIYKWLDR